MAERRMFSKSIIDSDAFLDMSISARLLYYDLGMRADDDGFVNAPKKIMRIVGASEDDLRILAARGFLIPFESGVVALRHWRVHNCIKRDRYRPTRYLEEKNRLTLTQNGTYTTQPILPPVEPEWNQSGTIVEPQDRLGEDRIGKDRIGKESAGKSGEGTPPRILGTYQNVSLSDWELEKLKEEFPADFDKRIERLSEYMASSGKSYNSHFATIRSWAKKDAPEEPAAYSYGGENNWSL